METIITIDIETTAVRVIAFDLKGRQVAARKGTYPTFHAKPDISEQDPEQVFITVLFVLKGLLNDPVFMKKNKVLSIAFSSSMHSVLPIDKNGVPLGNAIIWADNRASKEATELKKSALGIEIYQATGTPIHPMSPLAKITWIKNHDPERFAKTSKFIALKEYILHQFTGDYLIDYSSASATGLFNIHELRWEQKSLNFAGITSDHLSEPTSIFNSDLRLRPALAKSLRLSDKTKIIIGSSDGCLATLGSGVVGEGQATISITSSGAVRVAGNEVLQDEKQRFFNYILDKGRYISGGPTNNGGVAFEWFARQFGNFNNGLDFEDSIYDLFKDAAQVSAGADGLLFLPYLLGERAPLWNANARGVYFGINITHEQQHFVRATIEGILYEIYSIGKLLQNYRKIDNLYVNGTFATLPLWSQIISDMFGKQVNVNDNHDSSNVGAAMLALTEMGIFSSLDEAAKTIQSSITYQPNQANHQKYQKFYAIFETLSHKLADEFDLIAELQQNQVD
ncbi:gluconokinase [Emticicia sp. SJ17W-69]|uniref:gluconokinase n=1 Tax=Emticicia sp. SJ17W-69 TaxID=3421657 RepID=UPI003EBB4ECE